MTYDRKIEIITSFAQGIIVNYGLRALFAFFIFVSACTSVQAHHWQLDIHEDIGFVPPSVDTQQITLATDLVNAYKPHHEIRLIMGAGASFNYNIDIKTISHLVLGLRGEAFMAPKRVTKGIVQPLVNAGNNFDTLNYTYKMNNYLLLSNAQWIWGSLGDTHPYFNMGIGVVWNQLTDYTETAPPGSTAAPAVNTFRSYTQAQLAYGFGIGLDHQGVQLGYQMMALGKARLDTTRVQSTSDHIKTNNLYVHLLELTFCFS